jgi:beta-glucosidase
MLGTWSVSGDVETAIPIYQGMQNVGGDAMTIRYAKGANITDDSIFAMKANVFGMKADIESRSPQTMIDEAVAVAKTSDVIVAVVGEASEWAGEASSRTDLTLPASQKKLLAALAQLGKPLVIVNMSGRPMVLTEESQQATALLQMWNAGSESGNALADVLFGAYNPSAKLTVSFPVNVGQVPIYYSAKNTGRPMPTANWEKFKSAYLDAPNTPLYPFGYGLSYTKFSYSDLKLSKNTLSGGADAITATITVTNTGNYDGEEVVQLYLRDMVGSITRPLKELKGFQKIMLKKGESKEVTFTITEKDLRFYNSDLKWVSELGEFKVYVGSSSVDVKEAGIKL